MNFHVSFYSFLIIILKKFSFSSLFFDFQKSSVSPLGSLNRLQCTSLLREGLSSNESDRPREKDMEGACAGQSPSSLIPHQSSLIPTHYHFPITYSPPFFVSFPLLIPFLALNLLFQLLPKLFSYVVIILCPGPLH